MKELKEETDSIAEPCHGVVDAAPTGQRKQQAEKELREEKALSARERFLARKRSVAEDA